MEEARVLMLALADRTGLTSERPPRRYLWTDAFAVCNFLGLATPSAVGATKIRTRIADLTPYVPLASEIERFWLDPAHRGRTWSDHRVADGHPHVAVAQHADDTTLAVDDREVSDALPAHAVEGPQILRSRPWPVKVLRRRCHLPSGRLRLA